MRIDSRDPLQSPEEYLWVRRKCGSLTCFDVFRLTKLCFGALPAGHIERMLSADIDWVREYLGYVHGNWPLEIKENGPLPMLNIPDDDEEAGALDWIGGCNA